MYTDQDYQKAIKFALNYDRDLPLTYSYKADKDEYKVVFMDNGWYTFRLDGFFVRSCLKWKGKKQWCDPTLLAR
jgi:hypothetical protein